MAPNPHPLSHRTGRARCSKHTQQKPPEGCCTGPHPPTLAAPLLPLRRWAGWVCEDTASRRARVGGREARRPAAAPRLSGHRRPRGASVQGPHRRAALCDPGPSAGGGNVSQVTEGTKKTHGREPLGPGLGGLGRRVHGEARGARGGSRAHSAQRQSRGAGGPQSQQVVTTEGSSLLQQGQLRP